ncbi:MAG: biotin--[acetyl-CoA-carboxylase] ligase [Ruminiclostridium sp.]
MTVKERVLTLLEKNKDISLSGESMARVLSVSRNAVWKSIEALRSEGYTIEAGRNKGYRLISDGGNFSAAGISALLGEEAKRFDITIEETVTSTNTVLKAMAEQGEKEGKILIAREQTAGKGRLGRSFYSPKNSGLYISFLLRPRFSARDALYITTAAAAAVSEAIDLVAGVETEIKWVNDIYYKGKKLCGILTEASIDFESGGLHYAVLGIGINVTEMTFPDELSDIAVSLGADKALFAKLSAEIIKRFFGYYDNIGELRFLPEYRRRSFLIGKRITFTDNEGEKTAEVLDVDEKVRLVVREDNGNIIKLSSGEVNLVKDGIIR